MEGERLSDEDRDLLRASQNAVNGTQLMLQRATLEHEELKQHIVEKYSLHPADRVTGDGRIERAYPGDKATDSGARAQ